MNEKPLKVKEIAKMQSIKYKDYVHTSDCRKDTIEKLIRQKVEVE